MTRKIVEYCHARGESGGYGNTDIDTAVNSMIAQGWEPIGSSTLIETRTDYNHVGVKVIVQTMVRYEEVTSGTKARKEDLSECLKTELKVRS